MTPSGPLNLIVFLSNRCNLGCHYCAVKVNAEKPLFLDEPVLRRSIAYYLGLPTERKSVTLLGGEPFLDFPLLERLCAGIRAMPGGDAASCRVSVYTNGTLLDQTKLDALRRHDVAVWLSLDGGKESNDRHRTFYGRPGRSVFDAVAGRLDGLDASALRVNMVVHADSARRLVADVDELHRRGFPVINFHPELWEAYEPGQLAEFERAMADFSAYYRSLTASLGRPPFEVPILSLMLDHRPDLSDPSPWWERCENLVLGADGGFYACERDLAEPYSEIGRRRVGDAEKGVDWDAKERFLEEARGFLRRTGAAGKRHHACPKGIYFLARQRGLDPEKLVGSFQAVSGVFGRGLERLAAEMNGDPSFRRLYPASERLRARKAGDAPGDGFEAAFAASPAGAAAWGAAAHSISKLWEGSARSWSGLAAVGARADRLSRGAASAAEWAPLAGLIPGGPGFARFVRAGLKREPARAAWHLLRGFTRPLSPAGPWRVPPEAACDWKRAVELEPNLAWGWFLLGLEAFHGRRPREALEKLDRASALRKGFAEPRLLAAWTCHVLGRQDEASARLKEAGRAAPGSPWTEALLASVESAEPGAMERRLARALSSGAGAWARGWLGYALLRSGKPERAERELARALRGDPGLDRCSQWRAEAALARGRAGEAARRADEALRATDRMPTAFLARAAARLASGDAAGARRDVESAARRNLEYEWLSSWYDVHSVGAERDWSRMSSVLGSLAARSPRDGWPRLWQGQIALVRGEYAGALALLDQALELRLAARWRPWAQAWKGRALRRLGRTGEARQALERARGASGGWAELWWAELALEEGRTREAEAEAVRLSKERPDLAEGWLLSAEIELREGRVERALSRLSRACALRPSWGWAHAWRGRLAMRAGRWLEAADSFSRLEKPDAFTLALRGECMRRAGDPAGSALLREAAALGASSGGDRDEPWVLDDRAAEAPVPFSLRWPPRDPRFFADRGLAALGSGDFGAALEDARWILEEPAAGPWDGTAGLLAARALWGLGREQEALRRIDALNRLAPAWGWPNALAARIHDAAGRPADARRALGLALAGASGRNPSMRLWAARRLEPARGAAA